MRKFNLLDKTWGDTGFFVIRIDQGIWEPLWEVLQGSQRWAWIHAGLCHVNDEDIWSDAMHGYPLPLLRILKTPPDVMLRKCPEDRQLCRHKDSCPSFDRIRCSFVVKESPICYDVDEDDEVLRYRIQEIRDAWLQGRYGLLVPDNYEG